VVTASSYHGAYYLPDNASDNLYSSSATSGSGREWVAGRISGNLWIQDKCPDTVLLWRILLRGRNFMSKESTTGES